MIKVGTVEKVSRIDLIHDFVLIGRNSDAEDGKIVSHGNRILKYKYGAVKEEFVQKYFYFISFREGILYYEKEGEPIYYTDFKSKVQFAEAGNYFDPLQLRINSGVILITEMDESFNQSYYLFSEQLEKQLLPKFSSLILSDSFICTSKSTVELYSSSTLKIRWDYNCEIGSQLDKRNKIFSDERLVYIPIKGGAILALEIHSGQEKWNWKGEAEFVSYGEKGNLIYVHSGDKITIVSKITGLVVNSINYSDYDELDSFRSNGIIWCFEEILVVRNSGNGEVVLFCRESFEILGREIVDESGIGESKDRIQFLDNYLYILSTSNTVHIFNVSNRNLS